MANKERHYHLWPCPEWGGWILLIVFLLCLWDCGSGEPGARAPIAHAIAEWIRS